MIDNGLVDFSDEDALLQCANCTICNDCDWPIATTLRLCDDQRTCVREEFWCNGHEHCHDSSDELAVNCNLCEDQDEELFRCIFEGKDRQEKH